MQKFKKSPKVQKSGAFFDSANYELEKRKKAELIMSSEEKDKKL